MSQLDPSELDAILRSDPTCVAGRVSFVAHGRSRMLVPRPDGTPTEALAQLPGPLRDGKSPVVVGDWLLLRLDTDPPLAIRRLERKSLLRRRDPGGGAQPVAANLDLALICTALGPELSTRRVERWLALVGEAGIDPVVVLTKADPEVDPAAAIEQLSALGSAPVVASSALHGVGLAALLDHLPSGSTSSLLGSSGVGKSTLLNALLGAAVQDTAEVRAADGKGRHTTTARQLFTLPNGALIVDNPGVREVGLLAESGVDQVFPEIEALLGRCRYRSCGHQGDDGCALGDAVLAGTLDQSRVDAWQRLRRETAYEARRADAGAQAAERAKWKRIQVAYRQRTRLADKNSE